MESAHSAYKQSKKTNLTRVDLLIALYDKTLQTLATGIEALQAEDKAGFESERITAYRCIVALLDGIDVEQGEVARNVQRLCMYSIRLVLDGTVEHWETAMRILRRLHDSFVQIRDQAVALELNGEIPPLNFMAVFDEAVV